MNLSILFLFAQLLTYRLETASKFLRLWMVFSKSFSGNLDRFDGIRKRFFVQPLISERAGNVV